MQSLDLATVTTAAIVITHNSATFADVLSAQCKAQDPSQRHFLLTHNTDQKTIPIELIRELQGTAVYSLGERESQEIVLLYADLLSIPAQQAVLKLLEEPPARTRFWLVTDKPQALLPTIHSRCIKITLPDMAQVPDGATTLPGSLKKHSLASLAGASYSHLIMLAGLPKDRAEATAWCTALLHESRSQTDASAMMSPKIQLALLTALEQLQQNANTKLVLEHCFFIISPLCADHSSVV